MCHALKLKPTYELLHDCVFQLLLSRVMHCPIMPSSALVDIWVVFHKPCMSEDDGCLADTCDMEGGSF